MKKFHCLQPIKFAKSPMVRGSKALGLPLALFFLVAGPAFALEPSSADVIGKYGFDWLQPEKAKCLVMTEKLVGPAKPCKYHGAQDAGSFSGKADFHACKLSEKSEYMVYKTQARCSAELEAMQANAP